MAGRATGIGILFVLALMAPPAAAAPRAAHRRAPRSAGVSSRRLSPPSRAAALSVEPAAIEPERSALELPGLESSEHAASVTALLLGLHGVERAVVDARTRLAVVDYNPRLTRLALVLAACRTAGFEACEYRVESRFPRPIKLKGG